MLHDLNPQQQKAVTTINGPVLIVAGAGSGKTRVLTYRMAYLMSQGVAPENILAVTFTNKAAEEMRGRIIKLVSRSVETDCNLSLQNNIGTFHSICAKILRRYGHLLGFKPNFTIYDELDQSTLIKQIIKELDLDPSQYKPGTVREAISRAKDELVTPSRFVQQAQSFVEETIGQIYQTYQRRLRQANALDFDDLLMMTVKLFQRQPTILSHYQGQFKYILVDEYQDTNHSQYTLINLLAQKHQNLCVVGDMDQSIYQWRGADFRNILYFEKDFPQAEIILLEQNYRSSKNILAAANEIIKQNRERKEKNLWTKNPSGSKIVLAQLPNQEAEAEFIVREVEKLATPPRPPLLRGNIKNLSDFVVLYRTNAQSRALEEAFLQHNLPYKIIGGTKFYQRKEVKDILAYLKFIQNANDLVSLVRIINVPARGLNIVGRDRLQSVSTTVQQWPQAKKQRWLAFNGLIKELREQSQKVNLTDLINLVIKKISYQGYLLDGSQEGEARWENIQELLSVAQKFNNQPSPQGLINFIQEVALLSDLDEVNQKNGLVHLMTLHCAKGLEFPVVFIAGCEEGLFPHSRSLINPQELEEERRLCYVGLTRAQKRAYFTFVSRRLLWGNVLANLPSRFLSDIPTELIEWRKTYEDV